MGGSGGSGGFDNGNAGSGGYETPSDLINKMFGGGSDGTFANTGSGNISAIKSSLLHFAESSDAGLNLLKKLSASGTQITLDAVSPVYGGAKGRYAYATNQLNIDLSGSDDQDLDVWAHELFHAHHDTKGGTEGNTDGETQAYLFEAKVQMEAGLYVPGNTNSNSLSGFDIDEDLGLVFRTAEQWNYQIAMDNMLTNGWNLTDYNTAMGNFKAGSYANNLGTYDDPSVCADSTFIQPGPNALRDVAEFLSQ